MSTPKTPTAGRPRAAAPTALPFSPRDLWQMFQERWLIGLLVGVAAAVAFVLLQPKNIPIYLSEVSLLFEPHKDRVLNIPAVVDTAIQNVDELNVHLDQLRSQTFFNYLLASFTPTEAARIQKAYRDPDHPDAPPPDLATIIRPNVSVYVRRGTTIVGIAVSNRDPECAALIANRYAHRYIDFNLDRANTSTNSAIIFLRNQADETRAQVETVENSLQAYRARHNIAALGQNQNVVLQKVSTVGTELVRAQMEQVQFRSVLDKIDEYKAAHRDLLEIPAVLGYGQVAELRNRLDGLQAARALLAQTYLRLHPKMLANELETQQTQQLLDRGMTMAVANLEVSLRIESQHEQRLRAELDDAENKAHDLDKTSVEYNLIQQDAATKRAAYSRIIDRLNEATITSQMENTNIKIFDPAFLPGNPVNDSAVALAVKAGGIGAGLVLFVPLVFGLLDTRVKTVSHVEDSLGEVLLGAVKAIEGIGETERAHAFRLHKDDSLTEAYRGIYSAIDIHSQSTFPKAIVITSSMPGDGKSLTASNLAAVFAAHGRRTLLVDCDLRRPVLHRYFGVDGSSGWVRCLGPASGGSGMVEPKPIAFTENLDLLPTGGSTKNPTEAIERFVSGGMFRYLLERYDLVIFDTPPVAIFPDALLLCRYCKELVYVCKFGAVRMNNVRRTFARLHETGISVLGLILNQMPEARFRSCGYQGYGAYDQKYYKDYAKTGAAE